MQRAAIDPAGKTLAATVLPTVKKTQIVPTAGSLAAKHTSRELKNPD